MKNKTSKIMFLAIPGVSVCQHGTNVYLNDYQLF